MRKFMVAMMLLATVPFAIAASCGKSSPCADDKVKATPLVVAKPTCKQSPQDNTPYFVYPSSSPITPSARLK